LRDIPHPITTATGMGPLPELLEEAAGTRAVGRAFQTAELPLALVDDRTSLMPLRGMVELFAAACREAGDRTLGLRVGGKMAPLGFGIWMEYGLAAPSLAEAWRRLTWSLPLHQLGPTLALVERPGAAVVTYRLPSILNADRRQHSDHVVPLMIAVVRHYLGADWLPAWVEVDYPDDGHARRLQEVLPVDWRFGGERIAVPVPADRLHQPPAGARPSTARLLTDADVLAQVRHRSSPMVGAVEAGISLQLLDGQVGIDGVARRMRTSVRSLQRELGAHGLSYQRLVDHFRLRKANTLLARPDSSIVEIALALGYSDPSNFTRAYRRWTGHSPSARLRAQAKR
jgi:AraC-like DNA-binding protein